MPAARRKVRLLRGFNIRIPYGMMVQVLKIKPVWITKIKSSTIIWLNCMDCKFKLGFLQGKNIVWVLFSGITTAPYSNRWRMHGDFRNPRLVISFILVDLQEVGCISIKGFHFQIILPAITMSSGFMLNIKSGTQLMNNFCMGSSIRKRKFVIS